MRVNYQSDFDFAIKLLQNGEEVPFPDWNFVVLVWTDRSTHRYKASYIDGEKVNCYKDEENRVHITCDNHHLAPGIVKVTFKSFCHNMTYADANKLTVSMASSDIILVDGNGDTAPATVLVDIEYADAIQALREYAIYAKTQGDYAKTQGDYAEAQGDYAKTQGDYAEAQGDYAKSEVESWSEATIEDIEELF